MKEITKMTLDILINRLRVEKLNHTFIVFFPKIMNLSSNVLYKIISILLANRLKTILGESSLIPKVRSCRGG